MSDARQFAECILERMSPTSLGEYGLRVVRADPRVRIAAELLQEVSILTVRDEPRDASLVEDILTIRGDNRTVVYRVDFTDWDAATDTYAAEWPD